jgi:hypothetical protein
MEAPLLVVDKAGNAVAEISDAQGMRGITVYGKQGGSVFLGTTKTTDSGLIQLESQGGKAVAHLDDTGFYAFGPSGKAVIGMGATNPGGFGFLTIGNASGEGLVEAGVTDDGRGIVRVYPIGGPQPTVIPQLIKGGKGK